jgi:predicted ATPase
MSRLSIRSFGPLGFDLDHQPLAGLEYNKVRALLLVLVLAPERAQTRAALCALLWPELAEKAARNNLSQTLTNLRKVFRGDGEPFILATNEAIQINPSTNIALDIDVHRFENLIEACEGHTHPHWHTCVACTQRLQAAMQLYTADFLAEFSLPDSAPFEEWAHAQRERLRQRALTALDRLMRAAEWRSQHTQAIEFARRQIAIDPLNEASHRELIRLLAHNGQLAAANNQYDSLCRTLSSELGVEPEEATRKLFAQANADASKLPSRQAPPSFLPAPPSALIGREADTENLAELLRNGQSRLITLTGPAGVGKTRLAIHVAHQLRFEYADGVHVVELAPVTDATQVPIAIAQVLGLGDKTAQAVQRHLHNQHALLVLDNFEHVQEASTFVAELLARAPALTVLTTSRAALRVRAEQQYLLAPLAQDMAVQLFADRASASHHHFSISEHNAADVAAICERLDGLPLAIELIAVRVYLSSPAELARQLNTQMPYGNGSNGNNGFYSLRDMPPRHRTLHNAIRWSTDLLSDDERQMFAHVGVFAGGFTKEAMQAVVGPLCQADVGAMLSSLHHANLVQARPHATHPRFTILETVREFALAELQKCGWREDAQRRHAEYFVQLAEAAKPHLYTAHMGQQMDALETELDNIRAAVLWCRQHDVGAGIRMLGSLQRLWILRGHKREAHAWLSDLLDRALSQNSATALELAHGYRADGNLCLRLDNYAEANVKLTRALQAYEQHEDKYHIALTLSHLGILALAQGQYAECERYQQKSLAISREIGDMWNTASSLNNLAEALRLQGHFDQARSHFAESAALYRQIGDPSSEASATSNMATVVRQQGNLTEAQQLFSESYAMLVGLGDKLRMAHAKLGLAHVARAQGDKQSAKAHYRECVALMYATQNEGNTLMVLIEWGGLEWDDGNWHAERIIELLSMSAKFMQITQGTRDPEEQIEFDRLLAATRAALGASAFALAWARGQKLALADLVDEWEKGESP